MSNNSIDNSLDKTEGEPYFTALLYDSEEAAKYISEKIGEPLEKARLFVNACNEYEILLGIAPIDDEEDAQKIIQARIEHSDLLPPNVDCMDYSPREVERK